MSDDGTPTALANQLAELKAQMNPGTPAVEQAPDASEQPPATPAPVQEPTAPKVVETPKAEAPVEPVSTDADTWKHKFQVLEGKYRAETGRQRQEIETLKKEVETLKSNSTASKSEPTFSSKDLSSISEDMVRSHFADSIIEEWGMDICKQQLALQMAFQAKSPQQAEPVAKVDSSEEEAQKRFYDNLDRLNPTWEDTFKTPEFQSWLGTYDSIQGMTYGDILNLAVDAKDEFRVNALFERFASSNSNAKPAPVQKPSTANVMPNTVTPEPVAVPQGSITEAEWVRQLTELPKSGYSPLEIAEKQKELMAMRAKGKVIQGGSPQSAGNAAFVV